MKSDLFTEIIEELKQFVFKKSAIVLFLLPLVFFLIVNRFTNFQLKNLFFSDLISSLLISILSLLSIVVGRPLVAYTSKLARQWPLRWYWHPEVRPAYSEVTFFWFIYFSVKLIFQWQFIEQLGFVNFLLGWPSLIILLIFSYVYGRKRLKNLNGPSVEEFEKKAEPPWEGQKKGF